MSALENLQYPVGRFELSGIGLLADRAAAIQTLAAFPAQLAEAVEGLTEQQLDTPYRPQGWTVRQVVHHVADSHMNAYSRFKHALTTEWPTIFGYDQEAWAEVPDAALPVAASVKILEGLHLRFVVVFRSVPADWWATRGFMHPEHGRQTLEQVLAYYAWHARHHLAHVVNGRERLGS